VKMAIHPRHVLQASNDSNYPTNSLPWSFITKFNHAVYFVIQCIDLSSLITSGNYRLEKSTELGARILSESKGIGIL